MKASEFDKKFDAGEDISEFVDWSKMRRPGRETRRVNVDFPRSLSALSLRDGDLKQGAGARG